MVHAVLKMVIYKKWSNPRKRWDNELFEYKILKEGIPIVLSIDLGYESTWLAYVENLDYPNPTNS